MKLKCLLTCLCLSVFISVATAQKPEKVKKVTEKVSFGTATYQVLKSDKKTKHGYYKVVDDIYKQSLIEGRYLYGEKNGVWKAWYAGTNHLKNEGTYKANKKVGIWKYYDILGALLHTYNHDTKTLVFNGSCAKNYPRVIKIDEKRVTKKLDCTPNLLGGVTNLNFEITNVYLLHLDKTKGDKEHISATISILITKDGTVGEIDTNGAYLPTDFISILHEKINQSELIWLPGKLHGEFVNSYLDLKFAIQNYQTNNK